MSEEIVLLFVSGHPITLFTAFLLFMWLVYIWDTYLDVRQHHHISRCLAPPHELATLLTEEEFKKSKDYAIDKSLFSFVHDAYGMLETTLVLYYSVIPWLWHKVTLHSFVLNQQIIKVIGLDLGLSEESEIVCSLIFILYVSIFKFFQSLPWSLYYTFVLEAKHGFNKQSLSFFFKDRIKMFVVSLAIGLPIISILIWIIKMGGKYFYFYAYGFSLAMTLFMTFIYPEFIAPLFDRYAPLPESELRRKIEALAVRIGFPLTKLLVVEGSKRSSHSNAYFYGFWKNKRIVLFDTLIRDFQFPQTDQSTPSESSEPKCANVSVGCAVDEEIVAVLGHELGHWKCGHTLINLFISQLNLLFMFFVFALLMNVESIFISFGFTHNVPIFLRLLIIFQFIFSPYHTILEFFMTVLSRRLEFQADEFAINLGYGEYLKSALMVLHRDNLSFPSSDWLYSLFNHSHPPIIERISAIDTLLHKTM